MNAKTLKLDSSKPLLGLGWQPCLKNGWGVFGMNLLLEISKLPDHGVVLLQSADLADVVHPLHRRLLKPALEAQASVTELLAKHPKESFKLNIPVLHALFNNMGQPFTLYHGRPNIGFIFFENTQLTPTALDRAKQFDKILAGSTWNAEVLRRNGISHVEPCFQGIDPTFYHPGPKGGLFKDRFVIYSGGKLEYRKGHDIVVAAFKRFHARHPEAFLLTHWYNFWPKTIRSIDLAGYVNGIPPLDAKRGLLFSPWLEANGISPHDTFDVGLNPNHLVAPIQREADVALFPNRGEGGTNLVAMECLACGLPTILAANTGQLDLIGDDHCYPLRDQRPARPSPNFPGVDGWGESNLDEIDAALERVYRNRGDARQRGEAAVRFMQDWTWQKQTQRILAAIRNSI